MIGILRQTPIPEEGACRRHGHSLWHHAVSDACLPFIHRQLQRKASTHEGQHRAYTLDRSVTGDEAAKGTRNHRSSPGRPARGEVGSAGNKGGMSVYASSGRLSRAIVHDVVETDSHYSSGN